MLVQETGKRGVNETGGNANVMIFNTVQSSSGGKQSKKDGENGTPRGRTCQILKTYAVAADSPTADFAHTHTCQSPAAVETNCTREQTTVMRGPQRPMGSSANIYQRDIVLQLEVGMLLFQHSQDLRSECRIKSQEVLEVRPVKKHGLTQNPQREEGAGVQRLLLEQCLALDDHRGPRKHGQYQRSKDPNICLSIQGPNVSQIKSSLDQIDARGS